MIANEMVAQDIWSSSTPKPWASKCTHVSHGHPTHIWRERWQADTKPHSRRRGEQATTSARLRCRPGIGLPLPARRQIRATTRIQHHRRLRRWRSLLERNAAHSATGTGDRHWCASRTGAVQFGGDGHGQHLARDDEPGHEAGAGGEFGDGGEAWREADLRYDEVGGFDGRV